ncbi:MAG: rhodanese-like domain-containing protein [Chloroflexota bacterium]
MSKQRQKQKQKTATKPAILWLWLGLGAVLVLAALAFIFLRPGTQAGDVAALPAEITVAQAREKYDQGVFFLDVRTPGEWNEAHIPNTTLIPLDELGVRTDELPKDQEIVVVCRSGNRSAQARDILKQAGFEKVTSMGGGVNAWKARGYPTEAGTP